MAALALAFALGLGPGPVALAQALAYARAGARAVGLMVWGKGGLIYGSGVLKINLQYKHSQRLSLVLILQQ